MYSLFYCRFLARTRHHLPAWGLTTTLWMLTPTLGLAETSENTPCSLVVGGQIQDISCVLDPMNGFLIELSALERVVRASPDIALSVKAERGHLVLTSGQKSPQVQSLTGVKSTQLTVVVNGAPLSGRALMLHGTPHIEALFFQTVLERLSFSVLSAPDSKLLSVFRKSAEAVEESDSTWQAPDAEQRWDPPTVSSSGSATSSSGSATSSSGSATSSSGSSLTPSKSSSTGTGGSTSSISSAGGLLGTVQSSGSRSLQSMGSTGGVDLNALYQAAGLQASAGGGSTVPSTGSASSLDAAVVNSVAAVANGNISASSVNRQSASSGSVSSDLSVSSTSSASLCRSMDQLRSTWERTEPSRQEKETFKRLAQVFQTAKDNKGTLKPEDVEEMKKTLESFQLKVKARLKSTQGWSAPEPARRVKLYGEDFLLTVDEIVSRSSDVLKAIEAQDKSFVKKAEEEIKRLKELETAAQEQGQRFDAEVIRVRGVNGCGPARSSMGPS